MIIKIIKDFWPALLIYMSSVWVPITPKTIVIKTGIPSTESVFVPKGSMDLIVTIPVLKDSIVLTPPASSNAHQIPLQIN